jgi:predicted nucleic acid-binding protein
VIVLDTTVLVYATGGDHPLREPCRRLVEAVAGGVVRATTTVEVVQEFVHVRGRRRPRAEAAELGEAFADLLDPLLSVTAGDLRTGLRLFSDTPGLGAFDAVLAAAALSAGAEALLSADAAFARVASLASAVPDSAEVDRLLGS